MRMAGCSTTCNQQGMISLFCILLASFFKAVSDTLFFHYDLSSFKKKNPKFWNPNVSWQYAKILKPTGFRWDAWHISNSFMISFFIAAYVFKNQYPLNLKWYWELLIGGTIFNLAFDFFAQFVFYRKPKP
jgi:hypothetical protein